MITKATTEDLSWISQELQAEKLCYEDIYNSNVSIWKFSQNQKDLGFYGFEIYGTDALLRSVVVVSKERSRGLGAEILQDAFDKARELGIRNIYLLTFTAKRFFERHGFTVIERSTVPESIARTEEFANFCPDTAVCMIKKVDYGI